MKYQASLPEHNDNVSHRKPLREFVLILAALTALVLGLYWASGLAIDWAVNRMKPSLEARIHRALAVSTADEKPKAPALQARLQQMVDELKTCAGVAYPVSVQVETSEAPNAVVMPGAYMVVFSGLLGQVQSENGLSFVMAHELSHLRNRDHLRAMGRSLLLVAISTVLTGAHSDLTQILVPANQFGTARHSQARELAADSAALDILHCRYGHAGGATEFFASMLGQDEKPVLGVGHYFSSHPELQARIANLEKRIRERGYPVKPVDPVSFLPNE